MLPPNPTAEIADKLFPMAIANYFVKREDLRHLGQFAISGMMLDEESDIFTRLSRVTSHLDSEAAIEEALKEVEILRLTISDDESGIGDVPRLDYFRRSDENQIKHRQSGPNLEYFTEYGLSVVLEGNASSIIDNYIETSSNSVTLLDGLKAKRLFTINGFENSRVMHLVHDVIDHPWLFAKLRETGLFDKYSDFLSSIDYTSETYIYSRQAELIASVGFGLRRWDLVKNHDHHLILDSYDIEAVLASSNDERCMSVLKIFKFLSKDIRESAQFVIENMAIQIADERRRYGSVKQTTETSVRPMALFDPLYIAFLVESVVAICSDRQGFGNAQVQTACMVEEILEDIIHNNKLESEFIVKPNRLGDEFTTTIDHNKIDWFTINKSQLTSYAKIDSSN